jgi:hypothetical protein
MVPNNFFECNLIKYVTTTHHNRPDYDKNVFTIIHSFNNFHIGKQWKTIIDLEIEYLYLNLSMCNDVWEYACFKNNMKVVGLFIKKKILKYEQFITGLSNACSGGHVDMANFIIYQSYINKNPITDFTLAILLSCQSGQFHILKFLFNIIVAKSQTLDVNWGDLLYAACCGGNKEIIKWVIHQTPETPEKEKDLKNRQYWNRGLEGACKNGNLSCVQYMIHRGANDWQCALTGSLTKGHYEITEMILEKLKPQRRSLRFDLNFLFYLSSKGGNINSILLIINFIYNSRPNYPINWNKGLKGCCGSGNIKSIQLIIDQCLKNDSHYNFNWDRGLKCACKYGNYKAAELMIELGATDLNVGLIETCKKGNYCLAQMLIEQGFKKKSIFNWNLILKETCENGNESLAQFIFDIGGGMNFNWDWGLLLLSCCKSGNQNLFIWVESQIEKLNNNNNNNNTPPLSKRLKIN